MPFFSSAAAGGDEVAVLGVDERHRAELGAADERGEHLLVVDHQRALVGHEVLEGRHARPDHLGHVLAHRIVPVGDAHVVRVVGDGVLGALVPVGERLHQRLAAGGMQKSTTIVVPPDSAALAPLS